MHFVLGVVIPESEVENKEGYLASVMAPYAEEAEPQYMEECQEDCWECGGTGWQKDTDEGVVCERCNGVGRSPDDEAYMHNPNGHWDWYVVGGRWDGWFEAPIDAEGKITYPENIKAGYYSNVVPVARVLERNQTALSLITPDGNWHEPENKWGDVDRDAWREQYRKLLEQHVDGHCVVCVDCHT